MARDTPVRALLRDLEHAPDRRTWQQVADALDARTGADAWRAEDTSPHFDAAALRRDLVRFEALRAADDHRTLARAVHDSVARHLPDLRHPALFHTAWGGTKHVITRWLDGVCGALDHLATRATDAAGQASRRATFAREAKALGRTALTLSGGATLGFIHLGVVKALFEADLLPRVISGASMGAMIAAGVGTRSDAELRALFDDPTAIARKGLAFAGLSRALRDGALLDPLQLLETIRANNGHDLTFAEAEAHSGRTLVISLAPTRRGQHPRVLDPLTSPEVLLSHAALASAALPGLFPPAALRARDRQGREYAYLPQERWIDGSAGHDLPRRWLARLHDVDHVIVSQTNPHVIPFLTDPRRRTPWRAAAGFGGKAALRQAALGLSLVRQVTADTPLRPWTALAHAMASQEYTGDISIHPRFRPGWVPRIVTNPTPDHLADYVREGERATWPHLVRIDVETRIARTLAAILAADQRVGST